MTADAYPRLLAEASAFPLCSRAAQEAECWFLSWDSTGTLNGPSQALSHALIDHLRLRADGLALPALEHLRDLSWRGQRSRLTLSCHLVALAENLLEPAGARVLLRQDAEPGRLVERWRWISLCLPPDLLIAARYAPLHRDPPEDRVSLVSPPLERLLESPCAETHLHVGAAVPFGLMWGGLMRQIASTEDLAWKRLGEDCRECQPIRGEKDLRALIYGAALTRLLLAAFLRQRSRGLAPSSVHSFDSFFMHHRAELWSRVSWTFGPAAAERLLCESLQALRLKTAPPALVRVRSLYRHMLGLRVPTADPLETWLRPEPGLCAPEVRLNRRALSYLLDSPDDTSFHRVYLQYVRARSLLYRFLVEEQGTAGLDWFTQHYKRISPLRKAMDGDKYAIALREEARDLNLGALEVRTAPEPSWPLVRSEVQALANAALQTQTHGDRPRLGAPHGLADATLGGRTSDQRQPEVGLILHFIKTATEGKRPVADPRSRAFRARYGAWCHARLREAWAIGAALRYHPELLVVLRGVDIANLELAIPTWPVLDLFAHVREASERAAALLARVRPAWRVQPLRVTYHAGEDFRRLVEGIRRMHEPLQFGLLRQGDRIGHGLALGLDPHVHAERGPTQAQPLEERLDDLLWELERYQRGDLPCEAGRLELARAEALRLGCEQYGQVIQLSESRSAPVTVDSLLRARQLRHDRRRLELLGYPQLVFVPPPFASETPTGQLLLRYLTDAAVYERGRRVLEIQARSDECAMLVQAQRWLTGLMARSGITIEGNPSSNLLIGRFGALHEHPAFRFQPLPVDGAEGAVAFSLSTDNPVTFSTRLADEYAYVYDAMCSRGVSPERALRWLDVVREHGWRSRFTLAASADGNALTKVV